MQVPSGDLVGYGAQLRDDNDAAVSGFGVQISNSKTLSANNTTANIPIFSVIGSVRVVSLWAIVTTVLGNNTAAYWRLNDGTNQSNISLNTGTTLTNAPAGSLLLRRLTAESALSLESATQERVQDPGATGGSSFSEFIAVQETGGVATNIEFVYTTTDTPTTGTIVFYATYYPLGQGSKLQTI